MNGWLRKLGLDRPELRAWAMYDWANSAMACVIVTAIFPVFFARVPCAGMSGNDASGLFSLVTTIGMSIIAVLSPILGTMADFNGRKKGMLGGFLVTGALACAGMFLIHQGDWLLASLLFILANIGANGSYVFYDALLPHIASDDEIDRVSTAGYALGYIGGGILLAIDLGLILAPGLFGLPSGDGLTPAQQSLPSRLGFVLVAIWWLVFSIPMFRRVPEPASGGFPPDYQGSRLFPIGAAIGRLIETGRALGRYRQAMLMLIAFLIYNDGIGTIMRMALIYAEEKHLDEKVTIAAIVIVQFVGIPCAFLFGALAGRIGAKLAIGIGLVVYAAICVVGYRMETEREFLILAAMVGTVQGGTQALSRSLFASLIPRDRSGEFFGFFGTFEKFAGIFGPAVFFGINRLTGSSQGAILAIIGFFVVGGFLLSFVDVKTGQRMARVEETTGHP